MAETLLGATAAVGVGVLQYKRGQAPYGERGVLVRAIVDACQDAGIDPADVDGFVSYGDDGNQPDRLMSDLGTKEIHLSTAVWGGGGGGLLGAFELAATSLAAGQTRAVVVYRALVQGQSGRMSAAVMAHHMNDHFVGAGMVSPAQICALRAQRMVQQHHLSSDVVEALVRADYYHAYRNPDAIAYGQPFDVEVYRRSRWIAEPLRLFDCSRENDGAGAVLMVSAERAKDLKKKPVYLLGVAQGGHKGWGDLLENDEDYTSTGFESIARRLWESTHLGPKDIDVTQLYENFSYQGISSLVGHGLTSWEAVGEDLTFENLIAPSGRIPVNTNGGNLAQGFIHGINVAIEAVRQLRGESSNPVPDAKTCLVAGGPGSPINSSAVFANVLP
jgi:acetyl-CoA acetyltransferase